MCQVLQQVGALLTVSLYAISYLRHCGSERTNNCHYRHLPLFLSLLMTTHVGRDWMISFQTTSRKRKNSQALQRYDIYKKARTVQEFYDLGGSCKDIKHDYQTGLCVLKNPHTGERYTYSELKPGEFEKFHFEAMNDVPAKRPLPIQDAVENKRKRPLKRKVNLRDVVRKMRASIRLLKADMAQFKADMAQLKQLS